MRLIVGCTLDEAEVQAIEQGYDLRAIVENNLIQVALTPPDMQAKDGLAALAWLIAQGRMDVKVAIPVNPAGQPDPNGIREFIVGTGGAVRHEFRGAQPAGLEVADNSSYGVLKLTLKPGSYELLVRGTDKGGAVTDPPVTATFTVK